MNKKIVLIIILALITFIFFSSITLLLIKSLKKINTDELITGIENYDKDYYINKYGGDLDSNLSIFPNDISKLIDPLFYSSLKTNLFDTDGYILLITKYNEIDFNNEIDRLSKINITINENCYPNSNTYTNYIVYDENSYDYPAYITIDGFSNTYEYALINENDYEIIYVYLSYPSINNINYNKYLKKDKSVYSKLKTIEFYSIYNHSFDDNHSFMEYGDCK